MKRVEQRYRRLTKEGFPSWEARQLSVATQYRLNDPAMKSLRSARRAEWRVHKKAGLSKRSYNQRIGFYYTVEGLKKDDKYQVLANIQNISNTPLVAKRIRLLRIQRETPAGYDGRFNILRKAGFFPWESRILARMEDIHPDLRRTTFLSKPWQAMIRNHQAFLEKMLIKAEAKIRRQMGSSAFKMLSNAKKKQLAMRMVEKALRASYEMGKYSPFDWLKREYRPKARPRAYESRKKTKAQARTRQFLATKKQERHSTLYFD